MSESTVTCPKCGHAGIVITELLDSDLRLIADSQADEIEQLQREVFMLRNTTSSTELDAKLRLEECRRLLRKAAVAWLMGGVAYPIPMGELHRHATLSVTWYEAAKAAGGDDE